MFRRTLCVVGVAGVIGAGAGGCRDNEIVEPAVGSLIKVSPASVSEPEAWKLFDRSTSTGFAPVSAKRLDITLDRVEAIQALKVYGPSRFRIDVRGLAGVPLGVEPIDLSHLAPGWQVVTLPSISTSALALTFESLDDNVSRSIPELELWAQRDALPAPIDPTSLASTDGLVVFASTTASDEIAPGACASFAVNLTRPSSQLVRAYLAYEARGPLRPWSLRRSVNGTLEQGGVWIAGDEGVQTFSEELDPSTLQAGPNEVRLCAPNEATTNTSIAKVRIAGELDRGRARATARAGAGTTMRAEEALTDRDAKTTATLAADEPLVLSFERLIAPDAIVLGERVSAVPVVTCGDLAGSRTQVAARLAGDDDLIVLDGGALACATLTLTFPEPTTLSSVEVIGSGAAETVDFSRVVVTSPREHFGDRAWVAGYVTRPKGIAGAIRVDVGGTAAPAMTGDFGQLVKRAANATTAWSVDVAAKLPDGTAKVVRVDLDADHRDLLARAGQANAAPKGTAPPSRTPDARYGNEGDAVVVRAPTAAASKLRLGTRVGLDIPVGAVAKPTNITARHLGADVLPPLDPGMINVTAPRGHGYEFLPHGQKFAKPVEVVVPFDPQLIPEGKSTDDVHTYYFEPVAERWKKLARRSLDLGEGIARSETDHFTIMINAVLVAPTNPSPLAFDATTLSSIAAASPAANIDQLPAPQATPMGDARTALPIRSPAGRGAHTPSVQIGYSSSGGNSWTGVGWDVRLSRIEVDTRFGVPVYGTDTERYLLDGAAIVPTRETEGPRCRRGTGHRRYRPRIEGAFAHILRCERTTPDGVVYHFEVRDRDGTLMVYGDDGATPALHASLANYADPTQVARWQVAEVVDVHANTTTYTYAVDDIEDGGEPARELYPARIEYTSTPGSLDAAYRIEFVRDDGGRPDYIIDGRNGFKTTTRHLLRQIRVRFQGNVIRDYVLTYEHGQFAKTRLQQVTVYGVGGCAAGANAFLLPACSEARFFDHQFGYVEEPAQFFGAVRWTAQGDPKPAMAALARGRTEITFGSAGISGGIGGAIGGSIGGSAAGGDRDERLGLYDVDGDGKVDQLVDGPDGLLALYNQRQPTGPDGETALFAADPARAVAGFDALGREKIDSWGINGGLSVYRVGSVNAGFGNSTTRALRLLTDVDGDQFLDVLAGDGQLRRGSPCDGGLCFGDPQPFGAPVGNNPANDAVLGLFDQDLDDRLVKADPVIQWVAPFDGTVVVTGIAQKPIEGGEDGVTVAVFHQDELVGGASLGPAQTAPVVIADGVERDVHAGEAIYLRVATHADDGLAPDGTLQCSRHQRVDDTGSGANRCTP